MWWLVECHNLLQGGDGSHQQQNYTLLSICVMAHCKKGKGVGTDWHVVLTTRCRYLWS